MPMWIDLLKALAPVIAAGAWPLVCLLLMLLFKEDIKIGCRSLIQLFPRLNNAEIGAFKVILSPPESVLALPKVETLEVKVLPSEQIADVLTSEGRAAVYKRSRGVFLTHVFEPLSGGYYRVQLYLIGHEKAPHAGSKAVQSNDLKRVKKADFFLGDMWQNKIFTRYRHSDEPIGITVSAYGPFLCTCEVTFEDGDTAELLHYVDFEMQWAFPRSVQVV